MLQFSFLSPPVTWMRHNNLTGIYRIGVLRKKSSHRKESLNIKHQYIYIFLNHGMDQKQSLQSQHNLNITPFLPSLTSCLAILLQVSQTNN